MLKAFFTVKNILILLVFLALLSLAATVTAAKRNPIVITSQKLTADNKNNTAVFEGTVVATSGNIVIYSDKMKVSYNEAHGKISKLHAFGNVKVKKDDRAIFSEEAIYLGQEEKIIFKGGPRAVNGENVITGSEIIYFLKDDRTVIKSSNVVINNNQE